MSKRKLIWQALLLLTMALLVLTACDAADENPATGAATTPDAAYPSTGVGDNTDATDDMDAVDEQTGAAGGAGEEVMEDGLTGWLDQVNNGQITTISQGETFDYGLGYLVYYGSMDNLGVDNIIYNALEVRRRLDSGEVTEDSLSQSQQNLLNMAEGLNYDPNLALTDQVQQTPEVRQAILDRVVDSQRGLSPDEALASNNVVGVFAPPAPQSIGSKYLVYTQPSPEADFEFLGVVIAADAVTPDTTREVYSFQDWTELPWLGDAGGPFWEQLPTGVSGDAAATDEGRPGVLLISEQTYRDLTGDTAE